MQIDSFRTVAVISVIVGFICALSIAFDVYRGHRQKMWIMNIVWPVTALYSGPIGLVAYWWIGRADHGQVPKHNMPETVGVAATHCGSGCTLGDIVGAVVFSLIPFTLFGHEVFADWLVAYILAFLFGIAFQYFTIKPMKHLSRKEGLIAAVKADSLSLTAWQVGMYGWMALVIFVIFKQSIPKTSPVFWFMMQIAMIVGFLTAYPANWWLVKKGLKEKM